MQTNSELGLTERAATRIIDLFRAWDVDSSGTVTRKEFHSAMKKLGFNAPKLAINNLFDEWDTDDGGKIKLGELQKVLLSASLQDKKESAAARAAIDGVATGVQSALLVRGRWLEQHWASQLCRGQCLP